MVFANFFERTCDVQLKISDNSLFAILLRSHWWISFAAAAAHAAAYQDKGYYPAVFGFVDRYARI